MKQSQDGVSVSILGKQFMVACPEDERAGLVAAAKYLDEQMRAIHRSGKVLGAERCAIMAALNISHELLRSRDQKDAPSDMDDRIRSLHSKIESALRESA
jgi:cell division protein ZapA